MQRVLGIDPGLNITGYGLVQLADGQIEPTLLDAGFIKLDSRTTLDDRLRQLHEEVTGLVVELKPTAMAIEKLYAHYKHPRTAILMAHARGVILLSARQHNLEVAHLPSTAVKKALTGYGHASKRQMQLAVQSQCRLAELPSPPDVADAIAIALTFGRRIAIQRL